MRSGLALVVVLAAAGGLAAATAGAPFADDLGETDIRLENSSGPNGVYAVQEDGELAIRITEARQALAADGVNPGSVTTIENIFRIVNAENQTAEVWLTTSVEDVEFRTGTDSIEGPNNSVTLDAGEDVAVGLRIDTTGEDDVEQIDEFTVRADPIGESSTEANSGETSAAIGDGDGDATAGSSGENSDDTTTEGGSEENTEDTTTENEGGDDSGDRDDQSDTGEDPTTGDEDGQSDETNEDEPGDVTDGDGTTGEEGTTGDGTGDGTTGEERTTGDGIGDGPTDLSQSAQTAPFEPAQTLGGFLPQLLGLIVAIGAGAGLVVAARAIVGTGGN